MANWYGTARSNYFRVKDREAFMAWTKRRGLGVFTNAHDGGLFALHPDESTDSGAWPSYDEDVDSEFSLTAELAEHLSKDQIAVLMEAGAEKLRYVTGVAVAINSEGHVVDVDLSDIYRKAARKFRIPEAQIARAEY